MNWLTTALQVLPAIGGLFGDESKEAGQKLQKAGKKILGVGNTVITAPFIYLITNPKELRQFFDMDPILGWVIIGVAGISSIASNVIGVLAIKEGKRKQQN